ncbi:MAG: 30S ribosomal protein S16 [Candidatus Paceibacterota bacterium]|jgi:small subunit ribosomal protein S16
MLAIKLQRIGKKKQGSFRVVVSEKRSKMSSSIEDLGFFNPYSDKLSISKEKVSYWMKEGAQPTDSVFNLLITAGIIEGKKKAVHAKSKKQAEEVKAQPAQQPAEQIAETPAEEKPAPASDESSAGKEEKVQS